MPPRPATKTAKTATRATARSAKPKPRAASAAPPETTLNGISSAAVEKATGKGWDEWCRILDADGAAAMSHKDIAVHLSQKRGVGDWWSQMVTVGYEQARGRRVPGQKCDGDFSISASRVVGVPLATLFECWSNPKRRARWLSDEFTVRKATPNKSMRITWHDGTDLDVNFYAKGDAKSSVAIEHGKLNSAKEAAAKKKFWAERLDAMRGVFGG